MQFNSMLSPLAWRFTFLGRVLRYAFISCSVGGRGLSLPNQESVFFFNSGADDHTLNKQKTWPHSDTHNHWALNETPPCAPFWQE